MAQRFVCYKVKTYQVDNTQGVDRFMSSQEYEQLRVAIDQGKSNRRIHSVEPIFEDGKDAMVIQNIRMQKGGDNILVTVGKSKCLLSLKELQNFVNDDKTRETVQYTIMGDSGKDYKKPIGHLMTVSGLDLRVAHLCEDRYTVQEVGKRSFVEVELGKYKDEDIQQAMNTYNYKEYKGAAVNLETGEGCNDVGAVKAGCLYVWFCLCSKKGDVW